MPVYCTYYDFKKFQNRGDFQGYFLNGFFVDIYC
jgi:hypothetical protein